MKRLLFVITLTALVAVGCGKQEAEEALVEDASIAEELAADTAEGASPVAESESESVIVVEESAAEAEPEDRNIVLARTDEIEAPRNWKYKEGTNFTRMIPTQPTVGGADKIEVAEVFMYSCPHCQSLEPHINRWAETKDPNVRFVRIPAVFNQLAVVHAQLYYTEVFLERTGKLDDAAAFRDMVFDEYHTRGNRLTSETAIQRVFARAGVSEEDFNRTWNSFEVNQALRVAADLARRYNVMSVPMIVVNGKYRTDTGMAGGYPELMEVIDELTVREGLR